MKKYITKKKFLVLLDMFIERIQSLDCASLDYKKFQENFPYLIEIQPSLNLFSLLNRSYDYLTEAGFMGRTPIFTKLDVEELSFPYLIGEKKYPNKKYEVIRMHLYNYVTDPCVRNGKKNIALYLDVLKKLKKDLTKSPVKSREKV